MIIKDCASDLASALNGQTLGGVALVTDANLFDGQIHPLPSLAVFCLNTEGGAPVPYLAPTASAVLEGGVQVIVRSLAGNEGYALGAALARGVLGYLQQLVPSGYVSVLAVSSAPGHAVDPDTQQNVFSLNFRARYTT
jgi:hypothetical protein